MSLNLDFGLSWPKAIILSVPLTVSGAFSAKPCIISGNPKMKADWIEGQIKKGYDDILFFDDSIKKGEHSNFKYITLGDRLHNEYEKEKIQESLDYIYDIFQSLFKLIKVGKV